MIGDERLDFLWNIEDDLLILYGRWLLFMYARQQPLGNRAERCYAKDGRDSPRLSSRSVQSLTKKAKVYFEGGFSKNATDNAPRRHVYVYI